MISEVDIKDMYVLEEQPRSLGLIEKDSFFSIVGTPDSVFKVIASGNTEVIAKEMSKVTQYFTLPFGLKVQRYIWKH